MQVRKAIFLVGSIFGLMVTAAACDEGGSKKTGNSGTVPAPATTDASGTPPNPDKSVAGGRGFYLGFDGTNDYSLLLSQGREYKIQDPSIATIKRETVSLAPNTIDSMVEEYKKKEPELFKIEGAENFLRQFLGCSRPAIKITPLKAGRTMITGTRGGNNSGDRWGQENTTQIALVVTQYTTAQFDAGKGRYSTEGSGNLKACKSCHETGEENAPPHELGKISEITDAQAVEWITTGKTGGRTARITHKWEFSSDEQKQGVVAYLRGKASKDLENFTKLVFEEEINNVRNRIKQNGGRVPGPPPGVGSGSGTTGQSGGQFRCRPFGRQ